MSASANVIRPSSAQELSDAVRAACHSRQHLGSIDLTALNRILQHVPEDMTVKVEAGISLGILQRALAMQGQWIPVDPFTPGELSVEEMLASDLSGPRRYGFGPVRDHVIGMQVVLGDGRLIKSGGQVVKNVAGYDLMKLFMGSRRSLGVITEASFKLLPLPEFEAVFACTQESPDATSDLLERVHASALTPVVLDVYRLTPNDDVTLVVGIAGSREDGAWQIGELQRLGNFEMSDLSYEARFWSSVSRERVTRISVRPSDLMNVISQQQEKRFVARAGNGIAYVDGAEVAVKVQDPVAAALSARIKETYDPQGVLPSLSP